MKKLNDIELKNIIPANLLRDENILNCAESIQPELKNLFEAISQARIFPRINELNKNLLDLLAWQFHVDNYYLAFDDEGRRTEILDGIKWHMKKGTEYAILKSCENLKAVAEFTNWYNLSDYVPYSFRIDIDVRNNFFQNHPTDIYSRLFYAIKEAKAARSWFDLHFVIPDYYNQNLFHAGRVIQSRNYILKNY